MTQHILSHLLSPISIQSFYEQSYGSGHLWIEGRPPDHYDNILNIKDIDNLFQHGNIRPSDIMLTNQHKSNLSDWVDLQPNGIQSINKDGIFDSLFKGDTLVLNALEQYSPKLNRFVYNLSTEMKCGVQANIYITPPKAQGFTPHIDRHDVFILQIHGTKTWRLYDSPQHFPSKKNRPQPSVLKKNAAKGEFIISAGDLLYLPRGLKHDCNTTREHSIHATIGLYPIRWMDILKEALDNSQLTSSLRQTYPHWLDSPSLESNLEEKRAILLQRIRELSQGEIAHLAHKLIRTKVNISEEGRFEDFLSVDGLSEDDFIIRRNKLSPDIRQEGRFVIVRSHVGKRNSYPIPLKGAIQSALSSVPIRIRDIEGGLDTKNRLKLVRKLLQDGLLRKTTSYD